MGVPGFDETHHLYDRRGALKRLEDPAAQVTTQDYTGFGEPKTRTSPGTPAVVSTWSYDVLGRVDTERTGASALTYDYEETSGRLRNIFGPGGAVARGYQYDALGRLHRAQHQNLGLDFAGSPVPKTQTRVTTTLDYDALGRVSLETSQVGTRTQRTTGSTWDLPGGWRRRIARPDATTATESFDTLGRLTSMGRPGGRASSWEYQGDFEARVSSATQAGSPLRRSTEYDGLGQALKWKHTAVDVDAAGEPVVAAQGAAVCPLGWNASCGLPVQSIEVLRDKVGRIGSFSVTVSRPARGALDTQWRGYSYDAMGRVTTAHEAAALPTVSAPTHTLTAQQLQALSASAGAAQWSYARETSVGSLLSIARTTAGAAPRFSSPVRGPGHQLQEYNLDGVTNRGVQHDSAGRVADEGARTYVWDDFSALVVVKDSGNLQEALQYDGLGRLVARWNSGGLVEELGAPKAGSREASPG